MTKEFLNQGKGQGKNSTNNLETKDRFPFYELGPYNYVMAKGMEKLGFDVRYRLDENMAPFLTMQLGNLTLDTAIDIKTYKSKSFTDYIYFIFNDSICIYLPEIIASDHKKLLGTATIFFTVDVIENDTSILENFSDLTLLNTQRNNNQNVNIYISKTVTVD
jgi:hypothetical protein